MYITIEFLQHGFYMIFWLGKTTITYVLMVLYLF